MTALEMWLAANHGYATIIRTRDGTGYQCHLVGDVFGTMRFVTVAGPTIAEAIKAAIKQWKEQRV